MRVRPALAIGSTSIAVLVACSSDDGDPLTDRTTTAAEAGADDDGTAGDGGSSSTKDSGSGTTKDAAPVDAGPEESGEATYYDADGSGACGFPKGTDFMVAAMNGAQYSKSVCGKCVEVTGPLGKVTVKIVDLCPGCKRGDLDLSQTAFQKIAKLSAGRVKISWHYVPCP